MNNKNKKVRLYVNGIRHKDIYPHLTKWEVFKLKVKRFFARLIFLSVVAALFTGTFTLGARLYSTHTEAEVIKEVEIEAPILKKIAQAESLSSHYCTEKLVSAKMCSRSELGQVLVRANKNKTIDVGYYQINVYYWGAKATELGLNIFDEEDNKKMAIYIFKNYGSEPWSASSTRWSKN